jgi:hypothetical protein
MYEHRGVYAWTVEIWSPQRQAGIEEYKYIDWFREHPHEEDLIMLKWSDEKLEGKGYYDWVPYEHPQLGQVEIGGWDGYYAFRNPPPHYIESELSPLADWALWHAKVGPRLVLKSIQTQSMGGSFRVKISVQNTGWLPTNVTKLASDRKLCLGVQAEILRDGEPQQRNGQPAPDWLIAGQQRTQGPQLTGYSHISAASWGWEMDETTDAALFSYVLAPGTYTVKIWHDRAGTITVPLALASDE